MSVSEKVESEGVESQMLYLLIKDQKDKVRTWNIMREVPEIPVGRYTIKKENQRTTIQKMKGNNKNVETVQVNGLSYFAKKGKDGKLTLTPAPEILTFDLSNNKKGNLDLRSVCASVRKFIKDREDNGVYGVFNESGKLLVERLK